MGHQDGLFYFYDETKWCICDCFGVYVIVSYKKNMPFIGLETITSEIRLIWVYVRSRELTDLEYQ